MKPPDVPNYNKFVTLAKNNLTYFILQGDSIWRAYNKIGCFTIREFQLFPGLIFGLFCLDCEDNVEEYELGCLDEFVITKK